MKNSTNMNIDWDLIEEKIVEQFVLDVHSVHGPGHWRRVRDVGLALAESNGADKDVVLLFALFHDACRAKEFADSEHGKRGALLAEQFRGEYFTLDDTQFEKLQYACSFHTDGERSDDVTIGTCWDADRLDLGRVGETPMAEYMSTKEGKEYLLVVQ